MRLSYLYNRNSYTGKTISLYWYGPLNIPGKWDQYKGSWCPGSLHHQDVSPHVIDMKYQVLVFLIARFQLTVPFQFWYNRKQNIELFPVSNSTPHRLRNVPQKKLGEFHRDSSSLRHWLHMCPVRASMTHMGQLNKPIYQSGTKVQYGLHWAHAP